MKGGTGYDRPTGGTPQESGASPHQAVPPLRTFSVSARVLEDAYWVGAVPGLTPRHFPVRARRRILAPA